MNTRFPTNPSNGKHEMIGGKRYVWDGEKWDLSPLINTHTPAVKQPVVIDEQPHPDEGTGTSYTHDFSMLNLTKLDLL